MKLPCSGKEQETDFIVLLQSYKLIILIECKSSGKQLSSGVKQLYRITNALQNFLYVKERDWKILRLFYAWDENIELRKVHCDDCLKFIITEKNPFKKVMDSILVDKSQGNEDFLSHGGRLAYVYYVFYERTYPFHKKIEGVRTVLPDVEPTG